MKNNLKQYPQSQQEALISNIYLELIELGFNSLEVTKIDLLQIANILVSFKGQCLYHTKKERLDAINYWLAH